ncbi:MAG: glycosyltransferase [Planctomycetota bacterium]
MLNETPHRTHTPSRPWSKALALVAACNDEHVLTTNLMRSPEIGHLSQTVIEREHASASSALNAGLDATDAPYVMFVHQDVYLPAGTLARLWATITFLNEHHDDWGVIGSYGVDRNGARHGRVWSSGLASEVGPQLDQPREVTCLDELLLIVRRDRAVRFDVELPAFHLYGLDICQAMLDAGFSSYAVDLPVVHNSRPINRLDESYHRAYRYVQRKYNDRLPLPTCVVDVTRFGVPLLKHDLIRRIRPEVARPNTTPQQPDLIAEKLGYEYAPALRDAA